MSRRSYQWCGRCNKLVLMAGKPERGDFYKCPHGLRQSREPFPSTAYYENVKGERLYPWSGDALPSEYTRMGFTRREVSGFERGKFERDTRRQMNDEASRKREQDSREYEAERNRNHDELRQESKSWDDFHRGIAEEAMRQESSGYSHRYDSEFHIGRD